MSNQIRQCALSSLVLSSLALPVLAADATRLDHYVFGAAGVVETDESRVTGRGIRFESGYGRQLSDQIYIEGLFSGSVFNGPLASKDLYAGAVLANVQWVPYTRGRRWTPFLSAALGVAKNEDVGVEAATGLGIVTPNWTDLKLRLRMQAQAVYDGSADGALDYVLGGGIEFPIGVTETVVQKVEVEVEKIVEKEIFRDPLDSDKDGVYDHLDRCPRTLPGSRVDGVGCSIVGATTTLEGVNFSSGSDQLTPQSYPVLNAAVAAMLGQPSMRVKIKGHTDSQGSEKLNLTLSQKRADAVRQFLTRNGVDAGRISTQGYGETRPVASNKTAAGRARNRRVEFQVIR